MPKQTKEKQETLWKSDPERYAKCSQPFADAAEARAAVDAFLADISMLREKHLISDVEVIIKDSTGKGEDTGAFMWSAHFGNSLEREAMLAYAYGSAQKDRETLIARLLAGKKS